MFTMLIDNEQYRIAWHGGEYAVFNEYHSDPLFKGSHEECKKFLEEYAEKHTEEKDCL